MVGKYVHRAVVGAASTAPSSESASEATASARSVDAGASQAASPSDALTAFVERVVRRVLAEGSAGAK